MLNVASFLFNWGKKRGQAGQVSPSGLLPISEELSKPRAVETHTADEFEGLSCLTPGPFHMDAAGGDVEITYESVNWKKKKHYTQIYIDYKYMPRITTSGKPGNRDYLDLKHELLSQAYHSLLPYREFVLSLKGVQGRDDLKRALEVIIKRFVSRFWDMPASRGSHHAYPWGLVLHSIDVGCAEAEKATSWIPMSEHGIDEISLSRSLGMVVLLNFAKGLYHDAHKIFQLQMVAHSGSQTITYNPIRDNGNVLDFKIIYPQRTESWGEPIPSPGKANAYEFYGLFPREFLKYIPMSQYFDVLQALWDMEGTDSDRDSAKRDLCNSGQATLEQMILDKVRAYFTSESETTKPENNVFKVNGEWAAVISTQFLMKVRPMEGRVYTKDGVKICLQQEGVMAGTASKYELTLAYRMKRPNGKEEIAKSKNKFAFIKTAYLKAVFPDLFKTVGQVYFSEDDRASVLELCPEADNFLVDLTRKSIEQPSAGATAPPVAEVNQPDEMAEEEQATKGDENTEFQSSIEEIGIAAHAAVEETDETCSEQPAQSSSSTVSSQTDSKDQAAEKATPANKKLQHDPRSLVKWSKQLLYLLDHYETADSCPETGWLYIGTHNAYVRTPRFYQKMTNEELLVQDDWGAIAESICRKLSEEGFLSLKPVTGTIYFTPPGGGDEESVKGAFWELLLDDERYSNLYDKVSEASPLLKQG